jgi:hypothetical protein
VAPRVPGDFVSIHPPIVIYRTVLRKRRGVMDGNWLSYSQTVAEMPHHPPFCGDLPASGLVEAKTVCHRIGG